MALLDQRKKSYFLKLVEDVRKTKQFRGKTLQTWHREMWKQLTEFDSMKCNTAVIIDLEDAGEFPDVFENCFACLQSFVDCPDISFKDGVDEEWYVFPRCSYCPLKWPKAGLGLPSETPCMASFFGDWLMSHMHTMERRAYADIILNLKWKGGENDQICKNILNEKSELMCSCNGDANGSRIGIQDGQNECNSAACESTLEQEKEYVEKKEITALEVRKEITNEI